MVGPMRPRTVPNHSIFSLEVVGHREARDVERDRVTLVSHRAHAVDGRRRRRRRGSRATRTHRVGVALFIGALDIGFQAEHPLVPLPVVADLAAADDAVEIELGRGSAQHCTRYGVAEGLCGRRSTPAIADVAADIEPGPVVDGNRQRWRFGVNLGRKIGSECAGGKQRCNRRYADETGFHGSPPQKQNKKGFCRKDTPLVPPRLSRESHISTYFFLEIGLTRPPLPAATAARYRSTPCRSPARTTAQWRAW